MGLTFDEQHFNRAARRFEQRLERQLVEAARRSALRVGGGVVRRWPVDTGRSRDAWLAALRDLRVLSERGEVRVSVLNPTHYAPFLEYGTAQHRPLGIVQSELRTSRRDVGRIVADAVSDAWRGR